MPSVSCICSFFTDTCPVVPGSNTSKHPPQEMQEMSGWAPKEFNEQENAEADPQPSDQPPPPQQQQQQEASTVAGDPSTTGGASSQPSGYIYDQASGLYYDPGELCSQQSTLTNFGTCRCSGSGTSHTPLLSMQNACGNGQPTSISIFKPCPIIPSIACTHSVSLCFLLRNAASGSHYDAATGYVFVPSLGSWCVYDQVRCNMRDTCALHLAPRVVACRSQRLAISGHEAPHASEPQLLELKRTLPDLVGHNQLFIALISAQRFFLQHLALADGLGLQASGQYTPVSASTSEAPGAGMGTSSAAHGALAATGRLSPFAEHIYTNGIHACDELLKFCWNASMPHTGLKLIQIVCVSFTFCRACRGCAANKCSSSSTGAQGQPPKDHRCQAAVQHHGADGCCAADKRECI